MALSGPNETWLKGEWKLDLPVVKWKAWLTSGAMLSSDWSRWDDLPDEIACVAVYHSEEIKARKTLMWYVDEYPPPPGGWGTLSKKGKQVGVVNSHEWRRMETRIKGEV